MKYTCTRRLAWGNGKHETMESTLDYIGMKATGDYPLPSLHTALGRLGLPSGSPGGASAHPATPAPTMSTSNLLLEGVMREIEITTMAIDEERKRHLK